MYLTADRLAIADQAVRETFEQTSIVWQAVPRWSTDDPAQTRVPNGDPDNIGFTDIVRAKQDFDSPLAEIGGPAPDDLVARVILNTVALAAAVDAAVLPKLYADSAKAQSATGSNDLMNALIEARAGVEDAGYRAPSCLITNTAGLKALSALDGGCPVIDAILTAANVNSLYRSDLLDPAGKAQVRLVLIGRRQRVPHGGAGEASAGEEPVDVAVSVAPDLDVVGANKKGEVALTARVNYAVRIKNKAGLVAIYE